MARSRKDRGPDPGYCLFGAKNLIKQVQALNAEIDGVRQAEDIEYIHRMRVASRRIRAALPLFEDCFAPGDYKRWRREIRQITRALGAARDADVQIDFLQEYRDSLGVEQTPPWGEPAFLLHNGGNEPGEVSPLPSPADAGRVAIVPGQQYLRPGAECLLLRLQQHRRRLQPDVIAALDHLIESETVPQMQEACRRIIVEARIRHTDVHTPRSYERAFFHISMRLEELFSHEPFVTMPDQIEEHHEMRIAAKRLRYTMEIFADLYGDGLKTPIKAVKKLQDLLGDMHDCDVWVDDLLRFRDAERERTVQYFGHAGPFRFLEPGISHLHDERKKKRDELYTAFVAYWAELAQEGLWERLRETISVPLQASYQGALQGLADGRDDPGALLALIGDVHANLPALEAVLEDARRRGATAILNTGDFVGYGAFPDEVVDLVRREHVISVVGNYDLRVLAWRRLKNGQKPKKPAKRTAMKWAHKRLSEENRTYLSALPQEVRLTLGGKRILVTHGSPASITEYITAETPVTRLRELAHMAHADVVVTGHAHRPFVREVDGVWFINTGSVGRPDDGDSRACYALLDLDPVSVCHLRVPYDVEAAATALAREGLPETFGRMIRAGRSFDDIADGKQGAEATAYGVTPAPEVKRDGQNDQA
ncbi:CHAD domain-containing protein [Methanoculleus sp. FWC-SCC1]|uniref:CHAD domain-containing protein n=1 Tax=Methanoculleus frigidifontis TaxID=2584085 RepID=A0ABT8MAC4_9EURY|nr:CHAD domain-containing protein [Methanoculleus sp. FWC-SCC1]MDN7024880.1 CHAD domain-containing protein [Methanoculleus sp. FWC-SCC1]